ncbi:regulatory protein RecX [Amnibacterium endophyticum]|uniref:Regulatory protein RecX n=1 Tax=Amnibacterium endophyticum TaxID=2109337 RepID=A0ABW4LDE0_9MICO
MGEVLQGPWGDPGGDRSTTGAGRRAAGPGHPASGGAPDPVGSRGAVEPASDEEPAWAVPDVDADEPVPVPTRSSRRAENVAMAALTRHDASEGEIRAKLVAKGLEEADVEAELERLRRSGLVDDHAFAERLVDRLRERKGLGDSAIRSTLRGRLVPQAVVDAVLAEHAEDEDEAATRLQQVADDRARRLGSLPHEVAERRLAAYLMRKGYGGSAVRDAVRAALDGAGSR